MHTHTQNRERIERAYVRVSSENHPNIHVRLNGVFIYVKIIAFMLFMLMSKSIFQCILLLLLRAFAVASFYIMSFVLQNIFFLLARIEIRSRLSLNFSFFEAVFVFEKEVICLQFSQ